MAVAAPAAIAWLTAASTAISVYSAVESGKAAKSDAERKGRIEEGNAKNREIGRKRALINSLAQRNVRAGAAGFSGASTQAGMLRDIALEGLDSAVDQGNTSSVIAMMKSNAQNSANYSLLSAGAEAVSGAARVIKRGDED